jgi:spermidine synthase
MRAPLRTTIHASSIHVGCGRGRSRVLPELLALRTDPPLVDADDALRKEIIRQRQDLLNFYTAGIAAYTGDREGWIHSMQRVAETDDNNPYYQWVAGEGR